MWVAATLPEFSEWTPHAIKLFIAEQFLMLIG